MTTEENDFQNNVSPKIIETNVLNPSNIFTNNRRKHSFRHYNNNDDL